VCVDQQKMMGAHRVRTTALCCADGLCVLVAFSLPVGFGILELPDLLLDGSLFMDAFSMAGHSSFDRHSSH